MNTALSYFDFNAQAVGVDMEQSIVVVEECDMSPHERDKLHHAHRRYVNRLTHEALEARLQRAWRMEGKR